MTDIDAMTAATKAAPYETTARLILADAIAEQTGDYERAVQDAELIAFVARCQELVTKHYAESYPSLTVPTLTIDPKGRKYIRIVKEDGSSRSVYCFVERETGAIYKADGWKKPAKHARGNIRDDKQGMGGVTAYGGVYLR